jgi:site-specific recombinase XerD
LQGEFGIGLLSFWTVGDSLTMTSTGADQRAYQMTMNKGDSRYEVSPRRVLFAEKGTELKVGPLLEGIRTLSGEKIQWYLASELRDRIRDAKVRVTVVGFVAHREPLAIAQCAEIARIPVKKRSRPAMCYMDAEEIAAILREPDRLSLEGQRDYALLAFLYNTGARIQEALDVCPQAIRFESPAQVELLGKGRKTRICPLWPETVDVLKALMKRQPRPESEPIFVNRYGQPLGAAGVRFKLKRYVRAAARHVPSLARKRVTPHTWRHSVGVQLVAAGVDVTVIRNWLGHARLDTTNHYARANLETKRRALEQVDPTTKPGRPPRWRRDPELLTWLDSL